MNYAGAALLRFLEASASTDMPLADALASARVLAFPAAPSLMDEPALTGTNA